MKKEKLLEILKSGDFTIAYHDNGYCNVYRGKFEDYEDLKGKPIEFDGWEDGYAVVETQYLVEALGGKVVSI